MRWHDAEGLMVAASVDRDGDWAWDETYYGLFVYEYCCDDHGSML